MEQIILDDSFVHSELINHRVISIDGGEQDLIFFPFYQKGQKYPRISFVDDEQIVKPSIAPEYLSTDIFLEDDKSFWRRLWRHGRQKGFTEMLKFCEKFYETQQQEAVIKSRNNAQSLDPSSSKNQSESAASNPAIVIVYWVAVFILNLRLIYMRIKHFFYPYDKFTDEELISLFNPNLDWKSGRIRCFAWHPTSLRCALALSNDVIYVYTADDHRPINHICNLKSSQRPIVMLAWHPKRDDILAVSSNRFVLIWMLQSNLAQFKPDVQRYLRVIDTRLSSPVTSIVFNDSGNQLVACSPRNSCLSVITFDWTRGLEYQIKLVRKSLGLQFTRLLYSRDQTRLLAHTTTSKLCMFENQQWSYKIWRSNLQSGLCQASVWSDAGRLLLFVSGASPSKIFALSFYDRAEANDVGGGPDHSVLLLDTSQQQNLGSDIHQLCWDKKSTRLVISFKDQSDSIAIYGTALTPSLQMWPLCTLKSGFLLNHLSKVQCLLVSFHDGYIDNGTMLTLCWSNGLIINFPLGSSESKQRFDKKNETINSPDCSIRSLTSLCTSFVDNKPLTSPSILNVSHQNSEVSLCNGTFNETPLSSSSIVSPRRNMLFSTRVKFD